MNIFEIMYQKYKITKPIRLIELFGGYGSQHFALEYLGANFEHWKLVEWAVKSIQAYKDAHYQNDNNDYSKELSKDELIDYLYNKHISMDYNQPMKLEQIKRKDENWLRMVYNNIQATKNIVDIQNTKASDLEIVDTDKYTYIMTYSFPCQDLSLAGLGKGMARDSGTRSGMLWEVERILDECIELPQILLMENVPEVKGTNNVKYFNEWQSKLESLGYKNYHQNLIATDYGIPQTRNRCFMVSILGDYSYSFPKPIPLKLKLKDMLEDNVDEKYYIEDDLLQHIIKTKQEHSEYTQYDRYNGEFEQLCRVWKDKAPTLHTKSKDIKIYEYKKQLTETIINVKDIKKTQMLDLYNRNVAADGLCQTVDTGYHNSIRLLDKCRIRKLTPLESFRLMGVKDEDYYKIAKNQSNSSLYHLAGDSIVVNVLEAIFKELL